MTQIKLYIVRSTCKNRGYPPMPLIYSQLFFYTVVLFINIIFCLISIISQKQTKSVCNFV